MCGISGQMNLELPRRQHLQLWVVVKCAIDPNFYHLVQDYPVVPLQTSPGFYMSAVQIFENTAGKGEMVHTMLSLLLENFMPFSSNPVRKNLKFVVWKRVKTLLDMSKLKVIASDMCTLLQTKSVTKKEMNKCMAEIYEPGGIRTRAARLISQYHNH